MFIKKYVKDDKTYYMLLFGLQNKRDEKPHFIKFFIPEQLANMLIKLGVECKCKDEEK